MDSKNRRLLDDLRRSVVAAPPRAEERPSRRRGTRLDQEVAQPAARRRGLRDDLVGTTRIDVLTKVNSPPGEPAGSGRVPPPRRPRRRST